jgi:hypothetical protein
MQVCSRRRTLLIDRGRLDRSTGAGELIRPSEAVRSVLRLSSFGSAS